MEILDILTRESEITQQAYLYEEEGQWYAYENSAYMLNLLLQGATHIKSFINTTYEIMLNRVEVDLSILLCFPITSCSDSELIIDCSGIESKLHE